MSETKLPPSGRFNGTIQSAGVETDPYNPDGLVLTFEVQLDGIGDVVSARHSTTGKFSDITEEIVTGPLGLDWPYGIERISSVVGKSVPVSIKHTDRGGYRAYIATKKKGEVASADQIKRSLAKMGGASPEDEVPF